MKVRFFNIDWDSGDVPVKDDEIIQETTEEVPDDLDIVNEGADVLSDKYGWCVFTFDYEVVE
jgi:hypothetical protein